jgi:hypothetical protein
MKNELPAALESLMMLIYISVSLGFFLYFSYSLLVDLTAAIAFSAEVGRFP